MGRSEGHRTGRGSEHPLTLLTPHHSPFLIEILSPSPRHMVSCGQFEWSAEDSQEAMAVTQDTGPQWASSV